MPLGVEFHEVQGILILHPVMTLCNVDDDVLGTELLRQSVHICPVQIRVFCVYGAERFDYRFGSEHCLQFCLLVPSEDFEVDGFVQVTCANAMQNLLRFLEFLPSSQTEVRKGKSFQDVSRTGSSDASISV